MRAATLALLAEKGAAGVTIADVSARANVSVGTIYGRVGNRANLLRVVQEEELTRIVDSMAGHLHALRGTEESSVKTVIRVFVTQTELSAPSIGVLVRAAEEVGELAEAGPATWRAVRDLIIEGLLGASDAPAAHPPAKAMEWIFEVIDACTLRHIRSDPRLKTAESTDLLVDRLTRTAHLLLEDAVASEARRPAS